MNREAKPIPGQAGALMAVAVGAVISLPALVLGILLVPLARWRRLEMLLFALLGLGVTVLLYHHGSGGVGAACPHAPGRAERGSGRGARGGVAPRAGLVDSSPRPGADDRVRCRAIPSALGGGPTRARSAV